MHRTGLERHASRTDMSQQATFFAANLEGCRRHSSNGLQVDLVLHETIARFHPIRQNRVAKVRYCTEFIKTWLAVGGGQLFSLGTKTF